MRHFFIKTLLLVLLFASFSSYAQHYEKGTPSALLLTLDSISSVSLSIDTVTLEKETKSNFSLQPEQAGVTIQLATRENLTRGVWTTVDKNYHVWRASFRVAGARALNLYLRNFNLREGDKLFLYTPDFKHQIGAFTQNNNCRFFATGLIPGNSLVVEFSTSSQANRLPFEISELGVVVKNSERGYGDAGSCEIPINCEEGLEWQHQKQSVARILVKQSSSLFWCTGSLVNNTKHDGKPYFLTANHCGDGSSEADYDGWIFDFNYESPDCNLPTTEPDKLTFSGATLIAHGSTPRSSNSDFKLLLLKEDVPDEYHLFFNGWDRSGDIPKSGVVIHHPQGDIKFISTYNEQAVSSFYYGSENPDAPFWKVTWSETTNGHGVTEGGSSGSPLFNKNQLIIGTLTGGDASCLNNTAPDYFGKFSESWDQNGTTSSEQLKPWLDPDGTNVTSLEGFFKGGNGVTADFSGKSTKIISGNYVEFMNLSDGNITSYRWEFEGGEPSSSSEKIPGLIQYNKPGTYQVKLTVSSSENADTLVRDDYINVIGNIFPNPFVNGNSTYSKIHILTGETPLERAEVYITDILGRTIQSVKPDIGDGEITINPIGLSAGTYVITTVIYNETTSYKLVVINTKTP